MKLINRVRDAERLMVRAHAAPGLVWTADEEKIAEGRLLLEDERIALDVYVVEVGDPVECLPDTWRTVERVTHEPGDFGVVYGVDGEVLGRVREKEGHLVAWEPIALAAG